MKVRVEKPEKPNWVVPVIVVLAVAGMILLFPRFFAKPSVSLAYEIIGFEGNAQILDASTHAWRAPNRGEEFREGQKLKTGSDGMINFRIEDQVMLRLKENSEIKNEECRAQAGKDIYKLDLKRGVLLGATTKDFDRKISAGKAVFTIVTPGYIAKPFGAIFRLLAATGAGENKVGVLRGWVDVSVPGFLFSKPGLRIRGLEKADLTGGALGSAAKISVDEWQEMKEAYELLEKSAAMEARQIDLSKQAGDFYQQAVFDHGTFYTPKIGYANRDFYKDPKTGDVILETEYDVFPSGSFAGIYNKTRNFDISKYEGLSFEARRRGEEGYPDSFFIELKSKGNVIRRFSARGFHKDWTPVEFLFRAQKETPVNEMVFVFTNSRAGEFKKGILEFRNFKLMPKKVPLPGEKPAAPVTSGAVAKPVAAQKAAPSVSRSAPPQKTPVQAPKRDDMDDLVPKTISL